METKKPQLSPQQVMSNLKLQVSTLESKIRVNEQNIFNMRKHMQMVNHNLLDFKKEMRKKLDALMQQNADLEAATDKLRIAIESVVKTKERDVKVVKSTKVNKNMGKAEATKVLDDILKGEA